VVTTIYIIPPAPKNFIRRIITSLATSLILKLTDKFAYETYVAQKQCNFRPGVIIPEGIDVNYFRKDTSLKKRTRAELGISKDFFVLLYSGRLIESKGIVELLKAVKSLPDSVLKHFKLLLIGNVESDTIEKELGNIKNKTWFLHIPPVGRDDIKNYYCAADGFVLPSYYEGISSSLIEAMACELTPIVTNVGGNVEVVKHNENGFVVEPKDPDMLRKAIEIMVNDSSQTKKISKKARTTVVNGFSLVNKAGSYIKLYSDVLNEKK
jgi:glycosyltransferase involved in cell wall biosynthesis